MKMRIFFVSVVATFLIVGLAVAEKGSPGSKQGVSAQKKSIHSAKGSNLHTVNLRIKDQKRQIAKDLRSGKISKDQARAAFKKLKDVRRKELEFTRQNRSKVINAEQKTHLEKLLDESK